MFEYKMSRDTNGNKTVIVKPKVGRAFSVQTNDNLPKTHNEGIPNKEEVLEWVSIYGTLRQKALVEVARHG